MPQTGRFGIRSVVDFDRTWQGPPELRPRVYRTQSEKDTWYAVAVENEYRLGDVKSDDVVIDIGAHIGSFCHLAYRKGSRNVYGFELEATNFEAAVENLRGLDDGVVVYRAAVVRGDDKRAKQYYANGSWNAFGVVGEPVESVSLDEILAPHEKVSFLKIDAEGAEWPGLMTCSQLGKVQEIAGEYHIISPDGIAELEGLPQFSVESLAWFLKDEGFDVAIAVKGPTIGNFFAKRTEHRRIECPSCGYKLGFGESHSQD